VLQGLAVAVMAPVSLALVLREFPVERRAAGVGIWGAAAALAAAAGPPLGGVLVEFADWRWIFIVNVPIAIVVIAAGLRVLEESRDESSTGLPDLAGSALAAAGLGALALGIVEGENWGWTSGRVLGSFALAAVLTAWFARRCLTHGRPVVDPALMRIASFRRANVGTLLFAMAFFATILGNILFLTSVWRYSVLDAGLATIPGPLASAIVAGPAGRLADRFGHRAVIVPGALIYAAGLMVLRSAGLEPDYPGVWLPGMLLAGIGIGLAFPNLGAAAVAEVDPDRFGAASAVSGAFRQFGAVLGTALLVAIVGEPGTLSADEAAADEAYLVRRDRRRAVGGRGVDPAPGRPPGPASLPSLTRHHQPGSDDAHYERRASPLGRGRLACRDGRPGLPVGAVVCRALRERRRAPSTGPFAHIHPPRRATERLATSSPTCRACRRRGRRRPCRAPRRRSPRW